MTRPPSVYTVTVTKVTRKPSSINGNPRKVLHTEMGTFTTLPDAACAYAISDNYRGRARLTLTSRHSVIGFEEIA